MEESAPSASVPIGKLAGFRFRRALRRILLIQEELKNSLPWFGSLPAKDQFDCAMKISNIQRLDIQESKFFLEILPWMVAIWALFFK